MHLQRRALQNNPLSSAGVAARDRQCETLLLLPPRPALPGPAGIPAQYSALSSTIHGHNGRQVILHPTGGAGQRALPQQGLQPGSDRRPERLQGAPHRGRPLRRETQPAHRQESQSVVLLE